MSKKMLIELSERQLLKFCGLLGKGIIPPWNVGGPMVRIDIFR